MNKNFLLFFKDLSFNNIILLIFVISNGYSSYLQHKKHQEVLALICEEKKNIIELLDNKLEKFSYSLQLWTEKSSVGIERVKNKISLIQDKMADQHFLLASNIMQPPKVDSNFKITLFDQFLPSSLFHYFVFGVFVSCCIYFLYFSGYFNPFSYFDLSKINFFNTISSTVEGVSKNIYGETVMKTNMLSNAVQEIVIIDPRASQPFAPSAEDLELINTCISNLFK